MSERQYLSSLEYVLNVGSDLMDRTGVGCRWAHGVHMKFWLTHGHVPLLQSKEINWRVPLDELLWMIRGESTTKSLNSKIWDAWADENGNLGPIYGAQWRGKGTSKIDQLQQVVDSLMKDPHSRRHVVSAWAPDDIDNMALPPCPVMFQFNLDADRSLYCSVYMRSGDMFLGVPFDIFEYGVLTHMVARIIGAKPRELSVYISNAHIYLNHLSQVNEQLSRDPKHEFPVLKISGSHKTIDDFKVEDFSIGGYHPLPKIKAPVAV